MTIVTIMRQKATGRPIAIRGINILSIAASILLCDRYDGKNYLPTLTAYLVNGIIKPLSNLSLLLHGLGLGSNHPDW
jgi:hypothetical protein